MTETTVPQNRRTMSSQQKHRIQVPDGLRDVLLEFSIAYLLEQPGDVIDYAVTFFTKLQEDRKTTMITSAEPTSPDESIMSHDEAITNSACRCMQDSALFPPVPRLGSSRSETIDFFA
uniref:RIIa domain-containing protein n=1 Tax=Anopheles farauti TaxID=69004 RepID=A0A182PZY9_9DIPT